MKKLILLTAVCCGLTLIQAFAQEKPAKPAPGAMFQKLDLDSDGRVSKDEAQKSDRKRLTDNFDMIDTNKDGYLDKAELKAIREKMKAARKPE